MPSNPQANDVPVPGAAPSEALAGVLAATASGAARQARPMRPRELQDPLNHYLYHPLSWQLARRLAQTPITPNMVSVIGALCVIAAAFAYAQQVWPMSAALGLALHMTWHVVDGADGDLARMTGQSSPIGEMVDGLCDYLSHMVLYLMLGWMLSRSIGAAGWWWMLAAGLSHAVQSNHVEVQRRSYQYWVFGTPWLRNTHAAADSATGKSGFGKLVSAYLGVASGMTPHALIIDSATAAAQGNPARLDQIASIVRAEAPPLLLLCKWLGPNPRALVLGAAMLAAGHSGQGPLWYFVYQAVALNLLLVVSVVAHNRAARRMAARIGA
jgi:phosphatidylglycerophosphate synthase